MDPVNQTSTNNVDLAKNQRNQQRKKFLKNLE